MHTCNYMTSKENIIYIAYPMTGKDSILKVLIQAATIYDAQVVPLRWTTT